MTKLTLSQLSSLLFRACDDLRARPPERTRAREGGRGMSGDKSMLRPHGGYRRLRSFQVTEIIYDGTVSFCDRFVDKRSRTLQHFG